MMFNLTGAALYLAIFFGKLVEVTLGTARIAFVSKGRKLEAGLFALVEIIFWVIIAGSVITNIQSDPLKAVAYCLAYALGVVVGMFVEQKLALGMTSMQAVTSQDDGEEIGKALREHNFGVTLLDGHSVDGTKRKLVFIQLKRKRVPEATALIRETAPHAVVSTSDVRQIWGGFIK